MGKSPGKWIKTVLFWKKSFRSGASKGREALVVVLIGSSAGAVNVSRDIAKVAKEVHILSRSAPDGPTAILHSAFFPTRVAFAKYSIHAKGKSQWPELLNVTGEVAKSTIERENPSVTAYIIDEDAIVTLDFRCDRVRVRVNTYGVVTRIPKIG